MADYWGTSAPVIVGTWRNTFSEQVLKVACADNTHIDFKYYLNGRVVTGPDNGVLVNYKVVPEKRNPGGSFEEGKYIEITTGVEWDAERDIRLIRG